MLMIHCDEFCKTMGAKFQTRAAQNNHMMAQCLKKSLTVTSLARLEPHQAQYMFEGIKYAPLMYKTIMRLGMINSVTTTKTLSTSVNSNVDLINSYFDTNYTRLLSRGPTVINPITKLFEAYLSVPDYNYKQHIFKKTES